MAFFAKRRDVPETPIGDMPELEAVPEAVAGAAPELHPMVAKMLSMCGVSMAQINERAEQIGAVARDYTDRLQRIETKCDLLAADLAEVVELLRKREAGNGR